MALTMKHKHAVAITSFRSYETFLGYQGMRGKISWTCVIQLVVLRSQPSPTKFPKSGTLVFLANKVRSCAVLFYPSDIRGTVSAQPRCEKALRAYSERNVSLLGHHYIA